MACATMFTLLCVLCVLCVPTVAVLTNIAGLEVTNMVERSLIGKDLSDQKTLLEEYVNGGDTADLVGAVEIWSNGKNSQKSTQLRSIQGFCNPTKLQKTEKYNLAQSVLYSQGYCSDFVKLIFSLMKVNDQLDPKLPLTAQKWLDIDLYVEYELWDAVGDWEAESLDSNDDAVIAVEEGWTFYACNDQTAGNSNGNCQYADVESVASTYGQDPAGQSGTSKINAALLETFTDFRASLSNTDYQNQRRRNEHRAYVNRIMALKSAGAIQLLFKAAGDYVSLDSASRQDDPTKLYEAYIYGTAISPMIAGCSSCNWERFMELISPPDTPFFGPGSLASAPSQGDLSDLFASLVSVVQDSYSCMGVTCSMVGGSDLVPQCSPPSLTPMAGYEPATDVDGHARMDRDVMRIYSLASNENDYAWEHALFAYGNGLNSVKSDGTVRTLRGMSRGDFAKRKLGMSPVSKDYETYWGSYDATDEWITSLMPGGLNWGSDSGVTWVARQNMVVKSLATETMQQYSWGEMGDSYFDCSSGEDALDPTHHFDESVAFYVGGNVQDGPATRIDEALCGDLSYTNAVKRSFNFEGVSDSVNADANTEYLSLAEEGKGLLLAGDCQGFGGSIGRGEVVKKILTASYVSHLQGLLRYAYLGSLSTGGSKERAEGWAFARAILPAISACDKGAAETIRGQMDYFGGKYDDYAEVYRAAERSYKCLGLDCGMVGDLAESQCGGSECPSATKCLYEGKSSGSTSSSSGAVRRWSLSGWGGTVVAIVAAFAGLSMLAI